MDSEDKFWVTQTIVVGSLILLGVVTAHSFYALEDYRVQKVIEAGVSAEEAFCVIKGGNKESCDYRRHDGSR